MNLQRFGTLALSLSISAFLLQACTTSNIATFFAPPQTLYTSSGVSPGAVTLFMLPLTSTSTSTGALTGVANLPGGMCVSPSGTLVVIAGSPAELQVWSAPASGASPSFNVALGVTTPRDCAFDVVGNLYVVDELGRIFVYPSFNQGSSAGTPITSGINTPVGVTTDPSGNVFVSNNHTITEYSLLSGGNTLLHTINGNGGQGIKLGPDGNLYVANFTTDGKIDVFVPPFTNTSTVDHQISPPGATFLAYMAFDRAANLYVSGTNGSSAGKGIYVYAPPYTGTPVELDTALAGGLAIR
jgi:hypothetical protein